MRWFQHFGIAVPKYPGGSRRIQFISSIFQKDLITLVTYIYIYVCIIIYHPFLLWMYIWKSWLYIIYALCRHIICTFARAVCSTRVTWFLSEARLEAPSICSSQVCTALRFGSDCQLSHKLYNTLPNRHRPVPGYSSEYTGGCLIARVRVCSHASSHASPTQGLPCKALPAQKALYF